MLLTEPPPSQGDLHFRVFGFPVRVHPMFWIITAVMRLRPGGKGTTPSELLSWVAVVFVSILVHELGHAFLQRRYGGHPWITLYGLGGLASCDDEDRSPRSQILISLAGPVAGFLLALATLFLLNLMGHATSLQWAEKPQLRMASMVGFPIYRFWVLWEPLGSPFANSILGDVLLVNIVWGLINLLPVYPLDGGRVSREALTLHNPRGGIVLSLQISAVTAIVMAFVAAVYWQLMFTAILFGYLAYSNYQTLQAYRDDRW
ncbi:site-2 protease family protein [Lacipirellula parvula]|uniref:Membrane metalloprotease n=1 Tax=Lacipirellula parvula TaxID=2650471 RepID=A0A5K7XF51_9BACT|nr:site-2 protease family protein [Lacipirellula parvula]BBO35430.1 membrane metalloprotease [Lacipirellula parvula]